MSPDGGDAPTGALADAIARNFGSVEGRKARFAGGTALMLLGMLGTVSAITGCNTVAGAGKDIERGGEAIHNTAKDAQQEM
jgi:entericidin B